MVESGVSFKIVHEVNRVCDSAVKVSLFEEGFEVDGGEMRPSAHPLSSDFFQDIMDGFVPLEFKSKYPEGVKLIVEHHSQNAG
jgi:hypothetical protein